MYSLPSSSACKGRGKLVVSVLSLYDLQVDVNPNTIELKVGDDVIGTTNPPTAKHKEKNSFKYNQEIVLNTKPLSQFYKSSAVMTLQCNAGKNFVAEFPISSLPINESQWMILNLRDKKDESNSDGPDSTERVVNGDNTAPTLRLKVYLEGPYRIEIATFLNAVNSWFNAMDSVSSNLPKVDINVAELPKHYPLLKFFLIPAVPISGITVALIPILVGALIVGLPFFLPILVVLAGFAASVLGLGGVVYFSLPEGRKKVLEILHPVTSAFVATPVGQRLVYDTGSRPAPKTLAKAILPSSEDVMARLFVSLAIDFIGSCSYLLPVVGETFDVAWAPIQTVLISAMYDDTTPSLKYISFAEEILPFTDFVPSATIGWTKQYSPLIMNVGQQKIHEIIVATRREKQVAFA